MQFPTNHAINMLTSVKEVIYSNKCSIILYSNLYNYISLIIQHNFEKCLLLRYGKRSLGTSFHNMGRDIFKGTFSIPPLIILAIGGVNFVKVLMHIPKIRFALETMDLMCSALFPLFDTVAPRSLSHVVVI